jgi:ESCRT-II complex subunit VPS36
MTPLQAPSGSDGTATPTSRAGIDAVLSTLKVSSDTRQTNLSSAFADLEVLMVRAGEMVTLAKSLNDRLTSSQKAGKGDSALPGNAQEREEEATLIRSSLVQLGLPAPALTSDMVKSDEEYHKGLAGELGALLTGSKAEAAGKGSREGLMLGKEGRGVIGLDEAWGLWMRARGVGAYPSRSDASAAGSG